MKPVKPLGNVGIAAFRDAKLPLLRGTLSPARLGRVDSFYKHARRLCAEFGASEGERCPAAIALGVPEIGRDGQTIMRFPIYVALGKFAKDPRAIEFRDEAHHDRLSYPAANCLVGVSLGYLASQSKIAIGDNEANIMSDIERAGASPWLALEQPESRYSSCFKRAWSENGEAPGWHYIKPIVFDGAGIFAGFAVDFIEKPDKTPFPVVRENIERLLLGIYKSYYSHFGGSQDGGYGIDLGWGARGRVLDRLYLETLSAALDNGKSLRSLFPGSDKCLVFFCDGDGIKKINDQHLHHWGNQAIEMLAGVLCDSLEQLQVGLQRVEGINEAIVTRWGGDEFVVVMALGGEARPEVIVPRFKELIEAGLTAGRKRILNAEGGPRVDVDLSVGWIKWQKRSGRQKGKKFRDAWFRDADRAMYIAKNGARLVEGLQKNDGEERKRKSSEKRTEEGLPELTSSRVSMGELNRVNGLAKELARALGVGHV